MRVACAFICGRYPHRMDALYSGLRTNCAAQNCGERWVPRVYAATSCSPRPRSRIALVDDGAGPPSSPASGLVCHLSCGARRSWWRDASRSGSLCEIAPRVLRRLAREDRSSSARHRSHPAAVATRQNAVSSGRTRRSWISPATRGDRVGVDEVVDHARAQRVCPASRGRLQQARLALNDGVHEVAPVSCVMKEPVSFVDVHASGPVWRAERGEAGRLHISRRAPRPRPRLREVAATDDCPKAQRARALKRVFADSARLCPVRSDAACVVVSFARADGGRYRWRTRGG